MINETSQFYKDMVSDWGYKSAEVILPIVFRDLIDPKSVIDVGCGQGHWLKKAKELRPDIEILGLEKNIVQSNAFVEEIRETDLEKDKFAPMACENYQPKVGKKYDLAISLEVAEHIHKEYEDNYFEILTNCSDNILFSCAVPGQGGVDHVNEQWAEYWIKRFSNIGFNVIDYVRDRVWDSQDVAICYKNNTLFFTRDMEMAGRVTHLNYPYEPKIHPELYAVRMGVYYNGKTY